MGLFDKVKEPVFIKENSSAKDQIEQLQNLFKDAPNNIKPLIEQDIKILSTGIYGEDNIAYELRNSHMPMFILHDLYLIYEGLSAQIDYLIITRKRYFVVECKNLIGNIEINNNGDFIRTVNYNGKDKKEGIYSPITQNKRHLELIKQIRLNQKGNIITKALFEKYFYDNYRSIVVLANPKTILNAKYAKQEVKNQVIRADQLIEFIKRVNNEPGATSSSENETESLATFFMSLHQENTKDYTEKYRAMINEASQSTVSNMQSTSVQKTSTPELQKIITKEKDNLVTQPIMSGYVHNKDSDASSRNALAASSTKPQVIICPKCGSLMVKRKASKGPNAGAEFYGCSNFPKCHGVISI